MIFGISVIVCAHNEEQALSGCLHSLLAQTRPPDEERAANRDDLFSVTSLKHYPYVANGDFHKPKHLYSWKTLLAARRTGHRSDARCAATWTSR